MKFTLNSFHFMSHLFFVKKTPTNLLCLMFLIFLLTTFAFYNGNLSLKTAKIKQKNMKDMMKIG